MVEKKNHKTHNEEKLEEGQSTEAVVKKTHSTENCSNSQVLTKID